MNLRELLLKRISDLSKQMDLRMIGQHGFDYRVEKDLSKLAIGRWVPVSERLPEFKSHYWSGYMIEDGVTKHGIRSKQNFKLGDITHWLDLSLPEVES